METKDAIQILETESQNIGVNISKETQLSAALDLAIQILQGTLTTQLAELEDTKQKLDVAEQAIEVPVSMKYEKLQ